MDNDLKLVKYIKKTIKDIKFKIDYSDIDILSEDSGNAYIQERIHEGFPFMTCRAGATEMRCVNEYLDTGKFSEKIQREIQLLSGVFPTDDVTLQNFCEFYIDSMRNADLISLWGVGAESKVIHKYCENSVFTELRALEPYYFSTPWSSALKNKKVLVIHPFSESIQSQYKKRENLFTNENILPAFATLTCIQSVQSIAGNKTEFSNWFEALNYMKQQIDNSDFDVAIIGAGAYGLPLAAHVKSIGKQAIQMSGATQILFGIRGKRWDNHPVISQFYNEFWVRPALEETPPNIKNVEGGSYW